MKEMVREELTEEVDNNENANSAHNEQEESAQRRQDCRPTATETKPKNKMSLKCILANKIPILINQPQIKQNM
jgi:hypothetical protein